MAQFLKPKIFLTVLILFLLVSSAVEARRRRHRQKSHKRSHKHHKARGHHGHKTIKCPTGFKKAKTICSKVMSKPLDFDAAEDECHSHGRGYHLLAGKLEVMRKQIAKNNLFAKSVLLGVQRVNSNKVLWSREGNMTNIRPLLASGKGSCVVMKKNKLHRVFCSKPHVSICTGPPLEKERRIVGSKPAEKCPALFITQRKDCYRFFHSAKSFEDAEARCQTVREGFHLVSLETLYQNILMNGLFRDKIYGKNVWTGLCKDNKGKDHWTDGSKHNNRTSKRNWDKISKSTATNCTAISKTSRSMPKWERVSCKAKHAFICKGPKNAKIAVYGGFLRHEKSTMSGVIQPPVPSCKFSTLTDVIPQNLTKTSMLTVDGSKQGQCQAKCKMAEGKCMAVATVPERGKQQLCILNEGSENRTDAMMKCKGCSYHVYTCSECKMVAQKKGAKISHSLEIIADHHYPIKKCKEGCQANPYCTFLIHMTYGNCDDACNYCVWLKTGKELREPERFRFGKRRDHVKILYKSCKKAKWQTKGY